MDSKTQLIAPVRVVPDNRATYCIDAVRRPLAVSAIRNKRPTAQQPATHSHALTTSLLRRAIDRHQLSLHFQPQYEILGGRNCGVEALARWYLPDGHSIAPEVFIPHAEHSGLITSLGSWALQEACRTVAVWDDSHGDIPILCVNVSPRQICQEFSETLSRTLEHTGFPAARLELEITEGALFENLELALDCLAQWKQIGVRIALDDFGTGYSSLSYLSRLPVDRLKVDKALIGRIVTDHKTAAIVRAVISLGEDLGFAVLAEGVETEAQLETLASMGCRQVQGYLFTPPVCAGEAKLLLEQRWGLRLTCQAAAALTARGNSLAI